MMIKRTSLRAKRGNLGRFTFNNKEITTLSPIARDDVLSQSNFAHPLVMRICCKKWHTNDNEGKNFILVINIQNFVSFMVYNNM